MHASAHKTYSYCMAICDYVLHIICITFNPNYIFRSATCFLERKTVEQNQRRFEWKWAIWMFVAQNSKKIKNPVAWCIVRFMHRAYFIFALSFDWLENFATAASNLHLQNYVSWSIKCKCIKMFWGLYFLSEPHQVYFG